jgi:carboxylate-amine ligase
MLKNGTGADRQLAVFNKNKDMKELVDFITTSTLIGTDI